MFIVYTAPEINVNQGTNEK